MLAGDLTFTPIADGTPDSYKILLSGTRFEVRDVPTDTLLVATEADNFDNFIIRGSSDSESVTVDFSGGVITNPIIFNGGAPATGMGDTLAFDNVSANAVTREFANASDGSFMITIGASVAEIRYTGLETVIDDLDSDTRVFNFSDASETITVSDAGGGQTTVDSTASGITTFNNLSGSLVINAGDTGNDVINVDSLAANYPANVQIVGQGNGGIDAINFRGSDISVSRNVVLSADSIQIDAAITADSDVDGSGDLIVIGAAGGVIDSSGQILTAENILLIGDTITAGTLVADAENSNDDGNVAVNAGGEVNYGEVARGFNVNLNGTSVSGGSVTADGNIDITSMGTSVTTTDTLSGANVTIASGSTATLNAISSTENVDVTAVGTIQLQDTVIGDSVEVESTDANLDIDSGVTAIAGALSLIAADGITTASTVTANVGVLAITADSNNDNVGDLVADNTLSGDGVTITAENVSLQSVAADNGNVVVQAGGNVTLSATSRISVPATGTALVSIVADSDLSGLGDITMRDGAIIDATDGNVNLVAAGNVLLSGLLASDVAVTSRQGSILDNGDSDTDIIATTATLTASIDIGAPMVGDIDVDVDNLTATTSLTPNPGVHGIWVTDSDDIVLDNVATADGVIVLQSGGQMSALNVTAGGTDRGISLTGTLDDVLLQSVTAEGDRVHVDAAGMILSGGAGINLTAGSATLIAGTDIGTSADQLMTNVNTIAADAGGELFLVNADGLTIDNLAAIPGPFPGLSGITADGQIVVTVTDTPSTGDDLRLLSGVAISSANDSVDLRAGDNVSLDESSTVAAASTIATRVDFGNADAGIGGLVELLGTLDTAGSTGNILVAGESDPDLFRIGNDSTGLAQILGQVEVIGGQPASAPPSTGDRLVINDSGNAAASRFIIDETTVRALAATEIRYESIETLELSTGSGNDIVTVNAVDADSVTLVHTNVGNDRLNLRSSAAGSKFEADLGEGNDLIVLGSTTNQLGGILGSVLIDGESNEDGTRMRRVAADGESVSATVETGDRLFLNNSGNGADSTFEIDETTVFGPDATKITYESIETIELFTGSGDDTITVLSTGDDTTLDLNTAAGEDRLTVRGTGQGSILEANLGGDNNTVIVNGTGAESASTFETTASIDTINRVTINNSGIGSGVRVETGEGNDFVTINSVGDDSSTLISTGVGTDRLNLRSSAEGSAIEGRLGEGNDLIVAGSDDNQLGGILGSVLIDGEGNADVIAS